MTKAGGRPRPKKSSATDFFVRQSMTTVRNALCPVYQGRLNRARSNNNLALKLPAQSSPAPRSANKERPERVCETKRARPAAPSPPPAPFNMGDGLKNNPFLLADKKVTKAPPPPPPKPVAPVIHPILPLNESQRAALQSKRMSMSSRAPVASSETEENEQTSIAPDFDVGTHALAPASPELPEAEEGEDVPDVAEPPTEAEPETGVQVMPMVTAPTITSKAAPPEGLAHAKPTVSRGDLTFRDGPPAQLLEALASISNLDSHLEQARAIEASAESLAEVLRRSQRNAKRARR